MQITAYTEEEVQKFRNPMNEGSTQFKVMHAEEKTSKAGNPMIELQLKLWDVEGNTTVIYDYLVGTPRMAFKIKHFCEAIHHMDWYDREDIQCKDLVGTEGVCEVRWRKGKDKNGNNIMRLQVEDYVDAQQTKNNDDLKDDDIVF